MTKFSVFTLYPELFPGPLGASIIGRALDKGLWHLDVHNIRQWATDKHQTVDDAPFGGGPGMVMLPEILDAALTAVNQQQPFDKLIYLSPRGHVWCQDKAEPLMQHEHVGLICGRFEGIDQRVLDKWAVEEVSIGDYILAGGEVAAMVLVESCIRLLQNVMNSGKSMEEESFVMGLLEYPHYTRPQEWEGRVVPEILVSGHHKAIAEWRHRQAEEITRRQRPDLWQAYVAKND